MEPFCAGVTFTLGKTDKEVCPVTALIVMPYLAIRGPQKGPLFFTEAHNYLTQPMFCSSLKELLQQAGLHTNQCNTQIDAATTAKSVGISAYHINALGR